MRWVVGLLLLSAAVLKSIQILSEPAVALATGRLLLPLQVGVELGIGLLALAGLNWRQVRWLALLLFMGFAGYSLYLAMSGAASCGCFGPLNIDPWWTFFLDVAVVIGLSLTLRGRRRPSVAPDLGDAPIAVHSTGRQYFIVAVMSVCVVSVALFVRYVGQRTAAAPARLPGCQNALPCHEQLASMGEKVALIEVPPYGDHQRTGSSYRHGRPDDDREWFVQTPVEIQLQDGLVTAADTHGH